MQEVKLAIIIVNWNTKGLLERCLVNIPKDISCEVIVVDNGSTDGSSALVREKFPDVKLILNEDNLGYAVSNNKALGVANGKYILFLNTDVILTEGAISRLIEFMDTHPNAGLCTPSLIRQDGSLQEAYISFPKITTELFGRFPRREKIEPCKVQSIRGACMLARRGIINALGGFNERYFLFLEETDLCKRLFKEGYEVWYVPTVKVYHTGGGSAEKDRVGARIEYWRSRYIFFRENYSLPRYLLLNLGLLIKLGFDWILNIYNRDRFRQYRTIILWHILGKPGDWGIGIRAVNEVDISSWEGKGVLLKENRSRKLILYNDMCIKIYKSVFKKPWIKEWRLINRVRQLDIPTVVPIGCGDRCLVTKKIDGVKSLHRFILEGKISFNEKLILINSLAQFLRKIHLKGIYHGDLHAGNILIERKNGGYRFYITDLHRARIKIHLSKRDIINNLVQLDKFFSIEVSPSSRLRFLKYYVSGTPFKDYAKKISKKTDSGCHRLWRKRDRLYLKKDKYGVRGRHKEIRYILNPSYKDIDIGSLLGCIKHGYGDVIKDSRSSFLSRFDIPGIGYAVQKIYRQKKFINYIKDCFRKSRGFKAWQGSWALITRGIETPEPVLAGEIRRFGILKSSFIITKEVQGAKNLVLFTLSDPCPSTGRRGEGEGVGLTDKLSSYIKKIHNRGIFPLDMKGSNIIVQKKDSDISFYLIDLGHIKIIRKIPLDKRLYNTRQIKRSTGLFPSAALPIRRILIVKPSSLGDIVQALPVSAILRKEFPGASIWWLANRDYIDLLKIVPSIDKTIAFERELWGKWRNIGRAFLEFSKFLIDIRQMHFDLVLDLQGLFRSGFITGFSGAPIRIGFGNARPVRGSPRRASNGAREFGSIFYNNRIYPNVIHAQGRYLLMARYVSTSLYGAGQLSIPDKINHWAEDVWGGKAEARIAVNPGTRWHTKRWHIDRYAELIDELNRRYNARIILIGDKSDVTRSINSSIIDFTGKTTLIELSAILNGCTLLITNDSGPMHLADYLGKPVVAIFGPTDPKRTGPVGEKTRIIKASVPCRPCFKRYCKNLVCMDEVGVNDVLNVVEDVLQRYGAVV